MAQIDFIRYMGRVITKQNEIPVKDYHRTIVFYKGRLLGHLCHRSGLFEDPIEAQGFSNMLNNYYKSRGIPHIVYIDNYIDHEYLKEELYNCYIDEDAEDEN